MPYLDVTKDGDWMGYPGENKQKWQTTCGHVMFFWIGHWFMIRSVFLFHIHVSLLKVSLLRVSWITTEELRMTMLLLVLRFRRGTIKAIRKTFLPNTAGGCTVQFSPFNKFRVEGNWWYAMIYQGIEQNLTFGRGWNSFRCRPNMATVIAVFVVAIKTLDGFINQLRAAL